MAADRPAPAAAPGAPNVAAADPAPFYALGAGAALVAVAVAGYLLSEVKSPTAFIPGGFGLVLIVCGLIARTGLKALKIAMHIAALVGLLGFLAGAGRLGMVLAKGGGSTLGMVSLAAMAVICAVFLVLCVKSFRDARKRREAAV
ncbi:hypothetical protein [Alienimonas californiensis]|uniref:Uncharacterized protein n=1 Tax=Alienimonas californiensis TaxID=2527989 RepID=A0A517P8F0_9PLAN|nr:hypothetical protein [Alienimonas californiensis]QDT15652.1 hypothetical protein CA12_17370 [Alienimonas californiensis]